MQKIYYFIKTYLRFFPPISKGISYSTGLELLKNSAVQIKSSLYPD